MFTGISFNEILTVMLLRYLVIAGAAYGFFYYWKRRRWQHRKIQPLFPKKKLVRQEILYSLLTTAIFAVVLYLVFVSPLRRYTRVYYDIHDYSLTWFFISVVVCIVLHDTYFYWTHRLMHWKKIFRYVHHIHHKSHNPTPWAAFSFHPLEALVEVGIAPLIAFCIPIHPLAFSLFGLYMIVMNVLGHLGYELFAPGMVRHRLWKWHNTATHHNMHHKYSKCNYGLYFNLWDRVMGTNHHRYETTFEETVARDRNRLS